MKGNITIEIDGFRFETNTINNGETEIKAFGEDRYGYLENGELYKINVIEFDMNSRLCTVEINGQFKKVRIFRELDNMIEKMGLNASHTKKQNLILAPMPGLVREITVTTGDHVEKGHTLLILEAMKMENVISAPHQAVIKEIHIKKGQAVERGLVLMEFY